MKHSTKSWSNLFERYFSEIMSEKEPRITKKGPYISISRDFGCMANDIAAKLSTKLTKLDKHGHKWNWINKEILVESAKALDLSPSKIKYVFLSEKKSVMDEIIGALSTRYYKSDKKIRNTIIRVIKTIVYSGHVVIVGRGGVAFANDNPASIHVKLIAPVEWRIQKIKKNYSKSEDDARKYICEVDKERKQLIDSFYDSTSDYSIFDLIINRKTVSDNVILESIISLARNKGIV